MITRDDNQMFKQSYDSRIQLLYKIEYRFLHYRKTKMIYSKTVLLSKFDHSDNPDPRTIDFVLIMFYRYMNLCSNTHVISSRKIASVIIKRNLGERLRSHLVHTVIKAKYLIDHGVLMKIVSSYPRFIRFIPRYLITRRIANRSILKLPRALKYVPNCIMTREMARVAVRKSIYYDSTQPGNVIQYVNSEFLDSDLIMMSVMAYGRNIEFIPEDHVTHKIASAAITKTHSAFRYLPDSMKTPEFIRDNIQACFRCIFAIPNHLKTPDLVKLAVLDDPDNIRAVPEDMLTDEVMKIAIQECKYSINKIPASKLTVDLVIFMLRTHSRDYPEFLIPEHMRTTEILKQISKEYRLSDNTIRDLLD